MVLIPIGEPVKVIGTCLFPNESEVTIVAAVGVTSWLPVVDTSC